MVDIDAVRKKYGAGEQNISADALAALLGVSIWTVYRLAKAGGIPFIKVGQQLRFKLSEVETALKGKTV